MSAALCLMLLGFCLPNLGTPVYALQEQGFRRVNDEGEPLPPGLQSQGLKTFATVRKAKSGSKAWIGVIAKNERASLIVVACLRKRGEGCNSGLSEDGKDCHQTAPSRLSCRGKSAPFTVLQCGSAGFVVSGEDVAEAGRSCDLLKASKEGR